MKIIIIIVLSILTPFYLPLFGDIHDIGISQPYVSGKIVLSEKTVHDTIRFSNGVALALKTFSHQGPSHHEWWTAWGFLFCDSSNQTAGFRYFPQNEITKCWWMGMGEFYFTFIQNSPDTLWNKLSSFPDSLSPIDTFSLLYPDGPNYTGKTIVDDVDPNNSGHWYLPFKNYNTIIFIQSSDNRKIAIQFDSLTIIGDLPNQAFKSLVFNWATDSLGNGIFKHGGTPVVHEDYSKNEPLSLTIKFYNNRLHLPDIGKGNHISIYNSIGREVISRYVKSRIFEIKNLSAGVYHYVIIEMGKNYRGTFIKSEP